MPVDVANAILLRSKLMTEWMTLGSLPALNILTEYPAYASPTRCSSASRTAPTRFNEGFQFAPK